MKVSPRQADAFARKPGPDIRAALVYGPDRGLAQERIETLAASVVDDTLDVFRYMEISTSRLKTEPALLVDEALAQALGGGRRVVVVTDASDAATDSFSNLLEHPGLEDPDTALVLARAGDLGGRSSLRKLFESASRAAAIACYADDEPALHRLAEAFLADKGLTSESGVVDFVAGQLSADRQLNRRELEKLALYVGNKGVVSLEDASACLGDNAAAALDDTVLAAADGDYRALERALERAWSEGLSPVALLRAGQRHLQRLHKVRVQVDQQNRSADDAMKALRPPVFWKMKDRFRTQAGRWRAIPLEQALMRLTETEILAKSTGLPDRAACARALLAVAQLARAQTRRR